MMTLIEVSEAGMWNLLWRLTIMLPTSHI